MIPITRKLILYYTKNIKIKGLFDFNLYRQTKFNRSKIVEVEMVHWTMD